MVLTPDQQRVKSLLTDTITLLCRSGLHFTSSFSIQALIGITVDESEVFLININESVQNPTTCKSPTHLSATAKPLDLAVYENERQTKRRFSSNVVAISKSEVSQVPQQCSRSSFSDQTDVAPMRTSQSTSLLTAARNELQLVTDNNSMNRLDAGDTQILRHSMAMKRRKRCNNRNGMPANVSVKNDTAISIDYQSTVAGSSSMEQDTTDVGLSLDHNLGGAEQHYDLGETSKFELEHMDGVSAMPAETGDNEIHDVSYAAMSDQPQPIIVKDEDISEDDTTEIELVQSTSNCTDYWNNAANFDGFNVPAQQPESHGGYTFGALDAADDGQSQGFQMNPSYSGTPSSSFLSGHVPKHRHGINRRHLRWQDPEQYAAFLHKQKVRQQAWREQQKSKLDVTVRSDGGAQESRYQRQKYLARERQRRYRERQKFAQGMLTF